MLTGGSDVPQAYGVARAWEALRVLAPGDEQSSAQACRPFAADRRGLVLGEGGAALVLEDWDHAVARGARIHGEIAGYGTSCDHSHLVRPEVAGQVRALRLALADAGLDTADIDYVNAHGTATAEGDPVEIAALKQLFGDGAVQLPVSATKSMHGHLLGAAARSRRSPPCSRCTRRRSADRAPDRRQPGPRLPRRRPRADPPPRRAAARRAVQFLCLRGSNAVLAFRAVPANPRKFRHVRHPTPETVDALQPEVAALIVDALNLEMTPAEIAPDAPLFGDGLGLDSIDVLEIALVISKRYGFQLRSDNEDNTRIFASLRALTAHIANQRTK
jgi:acyl carrier protein